MSSLIACGYCEQYRLKRWSWGDEGGSPSWSERRGTMQTRVVAVTLERSVGPDRTCQGIGWSVWWLGWMVFRAVQAVICRPWFPFPPRHSMSSSHWSRFFSPICRLGNGRPKEGKPLLLSHSWLGLGLPPSSPASLPCSPQAAPSRSPVLVSWVYEIQRGSSPHR